MIQVAIGIQIWVRGMGKRGEKKPQAPVQLSSRVQDLVNQAAKAHGKAKSPAPTPHTTAAVVATPSRSKTLPRCPEVSAETPAKSAATAAAGETPVPMSVQSTGTPLLSPDYKRLRMEPTPSTVATKLSFEVEDDNSSSDGAGLRHVDTMSTLGYQFASTLNLDDGIYSEVLFGTAPPSFNTYTLYPTLMPRRIRCRCPATAAEGALLIRSGAVHGNVVCA